MDASEESLEELELVDSSRSQGKKKKKKKKRRSIVESSEEPPKEIEKQPSNVSFGKPPLQPKKVVEEVLEQTDVGSS